MPSPRHEQLAFCGDDPPLSVIPMAPHAQERRPNKPQGRRKTPRVLQGVSSQSQERLRALLVIGEEARVVLEALLVGGAAFRVHEGRVAVPVRDAPCLATVPVVIAFKHGETLAVDDVAARNGGKLLLVELLKVGDHHLEVLHGDVVSELCHGPRQGVAVILFAMVTPPVP